MFVSRAFNRFEDDASTNTIFKYSSNNKILDESLYLRCLPPELAIYFPLITDYGFIGNEFYIQMEKHRRKRTLGEIMINDVFDEHLWYEIYNKLKNIYKLFTDNLDPSEEDTTNYMKYMYISKIEDSFKNLKNTKHIKQVSLLKEIEINGIAYKNFINIWDSLKIFIEKNLIRKTKFTVIHGDLCFSNILCELDSKKPILKFIDPRGSFGKKGIYGDSLYDYAKLRHSFEGGYEYIIYDRYHMQYDNYNSIKISYYNDNRDNISKIFKDFKTDQTKLVEGLLFISMIDKHYDNPNRQLLMYLTGIKLLNEFLTEVGI